jgi:hypothetical protein
MRKAPQRVGKSASAIFFTLSNPIFPFYFAGQKVAEMPFLRAVIEAGIRAEEAGLQQPMQLSLSQKMRT